MPVVPGMDITISFIFALVITNSAAAPRCIYRFETPLLRRLGDLSYSIYMAHAPILWVLYVAGAKGIIFQTLGVALTLGAAYLLHQYFELPFMRLRERIATITPDNVQAVAETIQQT
jgi:peptidoglycan/LPS O-acetylase OafA/YrhL